MKLFLDDIRLPTECTSYMHTRIGSLNPIYLEKWTVVRNYEEFCNTIEMFSDVLTHVSFDHDLADEHYDARNDEGYLEKTGYDCAKFLKQFYTENNLKLPILFVHSMNPVGTQNIINLFKS
jgi:hypothetical protein